MTMKTEHLSGQTSVKRWILEAARTRHSDTQDRLKRTKIPGSPVYRILENANEC